MLKALIFDAIGVLVVLSMCLAMLMLFMSAALTFVRKAEAIQSSGSAQEVPLPPAAPAFASPSTVAKVSEGRRPKPTSSAPVNTGPAPEGNQPRQADLAEALLEHLEAQGYEFDPGPSPGR